MRARILLWAIHFVSSPAAMCHAGAFLNMLDGMQQLMKGPDKLFDRKFYEQLISCFDEMDPELLAAHDDQWTGIMEYAEKGGNEDDLWLKCVAPRRDGFIWYEYNCTVQGYGNIPIHEPCNYASNVAYYHTALEICKRKKTWALPQQYVRAMFRSFVLLASGSAFMHGSETYLGTISDKKTNDLFTYVAHQASVSALHPIDSTLIHELSYTTRGKSSIAITDDLIWTFTNLPVTEWAQVIEGLNMPEIELGWCALFSTIGIISLDESTFNVVLELAFSILKREGFNDDVKDLCKNQYVPSVRNATNHIQLGWSEKTRLRNNFFGMIAKLLFAFQWQESGITPGLSKFTPAANAAGAATLPLVNSLANMMMSYEYFDPNLQSGTNMYPGEADCNPSIPHAKWHLQTAIALTDMTFLADDVFEIVNRFKKE